MKKNQIIKEIRKTRKYMLKMKNEKKRRFTVRNVK